MSELVQLRQRIKSVETIKKITHAMRIISMSSHARLRSQQSTLKEYKETLTSFFSIAQQHTKNVVHPLLNHQPSTSKNLFILVGSEKGLCGNFNNALFDFFKRHHGDSNYQLITIGKKAYEFIEGNINPIARFDEFNLSSVGTICAQLATIINANASNYSTISVVSNYPKTFFAQKPQETVIIPFVYPDQTDQEACLDEYQWEESAQTIVLLCAQQLIHTTMYEALVLSLIAEQSARFIAMDNSTRNAGNILDAMNLRYNKTRQTNITRELTDLAGSL